MFLLSIFCPETAHYYCRIVNKNWMSFACLLFLAICAFWAMWVLILSKLKLTILMTSDTYFVTDRTAGVPRGQVTCSSSTIWRHLESPLRKCHYWFVSNVITLHHQWSGKYNLLEKWIFCSWLVPISSSVWSCFYMWNVEPASEHCECNCCKSAQHLANMTFLMFM